MNIQQHLAPVSSPVALVGYDVEEWDIEHINIRPLEYDENNEDISAFYSFGTIDPDAF